MPPAVRRVGRGIEGDCDKLGGGLNPLRGPLAAPAALPEMVSRVTLRSNGSRRSSHESGACPTPDRNNPTTVRQSRVSSYDFVDARF